MIVAFLFGFNAALSFALSLLLAFLLGPGEYGLYALASSVATAASLVLFEPWRLATTRFYAGGTGEERGATRAMLGRAYFWSSGILLALTAVAALLAIFGASIGVTAALIGAAGTAAVGLGWFDRTTAQARSLFRDRDYARLVGTRAVLAFGLAGLAALVTRDATATVLAAGIAALLSVAAGGRVATTDTREGGTSSRSVLAAMARYAVPLVAAAAIYALMPVLNRGVLLSRGGGIEAGTFSLASELGFRLFQNLGAALDLALFQLAVRAEGLDGQGEAERRAGANLAVTVAILCPAAFGWMAVLPNFTAVFVPVAYQDAIGGPLALTVPALACFALAQYGLAPLFAIRGRTGPAIGAATVGLGIDAAVLLCRSGEVDAQGVAAAQLCGFAAAAACLGMGLVSRFTVPTSVLPWRDLGGAVLSAAIMGAVVHGAGTELAQRGANPIAALSIQVAIGIVLYTACAWGLDLARVRSILRDLSARQKKLSMSDCEI